MKFNNQKDQKDIDVYNNLEGNLKQTFSRYYNIFKEVGIKGIEPIFVDFLINLTDTKINQFSKNKGIRKETLNNLIENINYQTIELLNSNRNSLKNTDDELYEVLSDKKTKINFNKYKNSFQELNLNYESFYDFLINFSKEDMMLFLKNVNKKHFKEFYSEIQEKIDNIEQDLNVIYTIEVPKNITRLAKIYQIEVDDVIDILESNGITIEDFNEKIIMKGGTDNNLIKNIKRNISWLIKELEIITDQGYIK